MKNIVLLIMLVTMAFGISWAEADVTKEEPKDTTAPSAPERLIVKNFDFSGLIVQWVGSGDDHREGQAASYILKRHEVPIDNEELWEAAQDLPIEKLSGPKDKLIRVRVRAIKMGDLGYLAVKAKDEAGNVSILSNSVDFRVENPFEDWKSYLTEDKSEALEVGKESNGNGLKGCLGLHLKSGDVLLGKYHRWFRGCNVAQNGRETTLSQVVRFIRKDLQVEWIKHTVDGEKPFPKGIKSLGKLNGRPLFLCRAKFKSGIHPGYIVEKGKSCNFSWGGRARQAKEFELLDLP